MMRGALSHAGGLAVVVLAAAVAASDTAFDAPGNTNPIVPGYFADPTIERFGDVFYLYATTDGNGGGRGPATVWVSKDFVEWVLVPMNWPTTPYYWAPDVVKRPDGRYYLYYNQPCNTYAGVSDSPLGPWTPVVPGDGLVIPDRLVPDVITLDTQVFEDGDGTLYGYWGTWGIFPKSGCGLGVFNPDMKSFARLGMIPNTQAKDFFEAPFLIERNGIYYLTYSSGSCHDASYRVQYAVGTRPDGEFAMGPNNPILATSADGRVHGPGHHSILRADDDYYIVYHRHDIPVTPNGMHRQVCADRLVFERDGEIRRVEPTHRGIGPLGPSTTPENLAHGRTVVASSWYRDTLRGHEYRPEYAVDDNNATLWRPSDNRMGHWLSVDLGGPRRVRRTETQFEYGTWHYRYLVETSVDGRTWTAFADRRRNTRWGSPMVDDGDVEARHVRITVTGTELPGLFGAIWNFRVFADAPRNPLHALADEAFASSIAPRRTASAEAPVPALAAADSAPDLLVHLDAAELQLGAPVGVWANRGTLGGELTSGAARPVVGMAGGRKAVRFSGEEMLTASFPSPRALAGSSSFTVAAWVQNPEIAESECIVSWAGRGGPDASTAQFGYGTHPEFGAVGHWGFADMGFRGGAPRAGAWHHIAVVYDGVIERVYVDGQANNAEAKMLLVHEGRPLRVGASEPGTEHLDGYLASLRVYGGALDEARVKELAGDPPRAEVVVHASSARLDYGPLASWTNDGSLGGAFDAIGQAPPVADVAGRIAVEVGTERALELSMQSTILLTDSTWIVEVANPSLEPGESVLETTDSEGNRTALFASPPPGTWQQLALVFRDGGGTCFANGAPTTVAAPSPPSRVRSIRLGGPGGFSGALTRVQAFHRALSAEEIAQLHDLWRREMRSPEPSPAAFDAEPGAISPTAIAMTARRGRSDQGSVEYRFTEVTGGPGGTSSGWIPTPCFLDDGLEPDARYAYTVAMRDPLGNVTEASPTVEAITEMALFQESSDEFATGRDFLAQGVAGTIWDGLLDAGDNSAPAAIVAKDGALRLESKGTVWDGGKPLGAFLFRLAPGDFVAEAEVSDYAGLADRRVPGNNDGGLMVRVPSAADAGPGEDLVQLNFFPIWNQGNMVTSLDGGRSQKGNLLAWDAHRHLQVIRQGALFRFRTSADGRDWREMPGSPVEREDMAGMPLQVGLYHASYGAETSHIAFRRFRLVARK